MKEGGVKDKERREKKGMVAWREGLLHGAEVVLDKQGELRGLALLGRGTVLIEAPQEGQGALAGAAHLFGGVDGLRVPIYHPCAPAGSERLAQCLNMQCET